jgi:hypothetical protein
MMNAAEMTGRTIYVARGARYDGAYEIAQVIERADGWIQIRMTGGSLWFIRPEHAFATESEAREAAKSRRQPRRQRVGLYGDFAALAAFSGIRTDGSGLSNHKFDRRAK